MSSKHICKIDWNAEIPKDAKKVNSYRSYDFNYGKMKNGGRKSGYTKADWNLIEKVCKIGLTHKCYEGEKVSMLDMSRGCLYCKYAKKPYMSIIKLMDNGIYFTNMCPAKRTCFASHDYYIDVLNFIQNELGAVFKKVMREYHKRKKEDKRND
jgi:hypothetical protein